MTLHEVEKGDGFGYRILFGFISMMSGMRASAKKHLQTCKERNLL